MKEISTSLVRQEVRFIPARMENHRHFQKTYACSNCEKTGTHTPFVKSEVPKLPLNNTAASASLIAETMYQKFEQKVPAYRQEAHWALLGYSIPRHNMTNWHIKCSEYYFEDLVSEMKNELLRSEVLHADETTFKVLADKIVRSLTCGCSVRGNMPRNPYIFTGWDLPGVRKYRRPFRRLPRVFT